MKGCWTYDLVLEHKLSITQCNLETDVTESLLAEGRSEVSWSCHGGQKKPNIFVGPLCNSIVRDFNFTALCFNHSVFCWLTMRCTA